MLESSAVNTPCSGPADGVLPLLTWGRGEVDGRSQPDSQWTGRGPAVISSGPYHESEFHGVGESREGRLPSHGAPEDCPGAEGAWRGRLPDTGYVPKLTTATPAAVTT